VLKELALLNSAHDVFIVLIDSAFAFELPTVSAGWIEAFDVETGRARVMSRGQLSAMSAKTRRWQDECRGWPRSQPRRPPHRGRRTADRDCAERIHRERRLGKQRRYARKARNTRNR
jgi:hypothetical protein